jgi:hypothetical protein
VTRPLRPYKLIAYEPGAANVIHRYTGERVGWVLQDHRGNWEAIGGVDAGGRPIVVGYFHWRAAAAEAVWEERE